jgi:hypothetical protein
VAVSPLHFPGAGWVYLRVPLGHGHHHGQRLSEVGDPVALRQPRPAVSLDLSVWEVAVKIRIISTEEECEVAADRIARGLIARYVSRPALLDGENWQYQVNIDARLPEQKPEANRPAGSGGLRY